MLLETLKIMWVLFVCLFWEQAVPVQLWLTWSSIHRPNWSVAHRDALVPASCILRLKVYSTMPSQNNVFNVQTVFWFVPETKTSCFNIFMLGTFIFLPKRGPGSRITWPSVCTFQCFSLLLDLGLSPSEGLCHPVSLSLEKRNSNTGCSSVSPIDRSEWVTLCFVSGEEFYISILSFIECEMFVRRFLCPLHIGDHPLVAITLKFKQFISQLGFWVTVL